jgi:hypothetical protein
MLDRQVVKEFIFQELEESCIAIPKSVNKKELVEAFCQFAEADYYEWLQDNFKNFFGHGQPDWVWIKNYARAHKQL